MNYISHICFHDLRVSNKPHKRCCLARGLPRCLPTLSKLAWQDPRAGSKSSLSEGLPGRGGTGGDLVTVTGRWEMFLFASNGQEYHGISRSILDGLSTNSPAKNLFFAGYLADWHCNGQWWMLEKSMLILALGQVKLGFFVGHSCNSVVSPSFWRMEVS